MAGQAVGPASFDQMFLFALSILCLSVGALGIAWVLYQKRDAISWLGLFLLSAMAGLVAVVGPDPWLDDDIVRYLWDGYLQSEGRLALTTSPLMEGTAAFPQSSYEILSYKWMPSVYPPLAQWVFGLLWTIFEADRQLWLLFFGLCSLGIQGAIIRVGSLYNLPKHVVWLVVGHPIIIKEFWDSGHVDALGVFLVLVAMFWLKRSWSLPRGIFWGLAGLIKPLALVVFVLGPFSFKAKIKEGLPAGGVFLLGFWLYFDHWQQFGYYLNTLGIFSREWIFNPGFAEAVHWLMGEGSFSDASWLTTTRFLSWMSIGLLVLGATLQLIKRDPGWSLYFVGIFLVVQPVVNTWYLAWLLPYLVLAERAQKRSLWFYLPWVLVSFGGFYSYSYWYQFQDDVILRRIFWGASLGLLIGSCIGMKWNLTPKEKP